MLSLLAELTGATDAALRELARRLAGRVFLDVARRGPIAPRGIGRLVTAKYRDDVGDLDLDASLDEVVSARAAGRAIDPDGLRVRRWVQPDTALCLLIDRSGSMSGRPLATAAVAAAAVAYRTPNDFSVVSFAKQPIVVSSQGVPSSTERLVDGVLALRGHGTTDVAAALHTALEQLSRSRAGRRVTVLLSDCRATEPGDLEAAARRLDELVIVAPEGDSAEAEQLAAAVGAGFVTVDGPAQVPDAFTHVLGN